MPVRGSLDSMLEESASHHIESISDDSGIFQDFRKIDQKNDSKMAKVEPPRPVKFVSPTIFEFQFSRTLKFLRAFKDKLSFDLWWLISEGILPLNTR